MKLSIRKQLFHFSFTLVLAFAAHLPAAQAASKVVVANRASASISVIDTRSDSATNIPMPPGPNPPEPMYIAYSATYNRVFVGDRSNNRVVVFSAADFSVEDTLAAGNGVFHMWSSDHSDQLWVNNDIDNTITVVDTVTLSVIGTVAAPADLVALGGKLHDVIVDPTAPYAYVTMLGFAGPEDYVIKFSTDSLQEVDRQAVGKDPHVSLARQNNDLYVPCQNSNVVFVLDRDTLDPRLSIPVPGAHGAGMARNGKIFYTTNLPNGGMDGLFAIDTRNYSVTGVWDTPVNIPHNIALTPNGKKIYITHSGGTNDQVSVFARQNKNTSLSLLTTVTVGVNPFGLAFIP